jgi:twitching motility protein PilT
MIFSSEPSMSEFPSNSELDSLRTLLASSPGEALTKAVKLLRHEDWNLRRGGADLIGSQGSTGLKHLQEAIRNESDNFQKQNLCYWASIAVFDHNLDDIPTLRFLFENGENHIKKKIMESMSPDSADGDLDFLFDALGTDSWDVREKASKVLAQKGQNSIDFLEQKFPSSNAHQRFWTFKILALILGSSAIPYFSQFLKQEPQNEQLQVFAVSNLGEINDGRVVKSLLNFLKTDSFLISEEVGRSLKKLVHSQRAEILKNLQQNPEPRILEVLLKVLSEPAEPSILTETRFLFSHEDHRTRYLAISNLGHIPSQETARILISCFSDSRWAIRKLAMDKVVSLGTYSVTPLLEALRNETEDRVFWALKSLVAIGEETTLADIASLIQSGNREIRLLALEAVLAINSEESNEIFLDAFDNPDWEVRQKASELFPRLSNHPIPTLLEGCLSTNKNIGFWSLRTLETLEMEGGPDLLDQIRNLDSPILVLRNLRLANQELLEQQLRRKNPDLLKMESSAACALEVSSPRKAPDARGEKLSSTKTLLDAGVVLPEPIAYSISLGELFEQGSNLLASDIHLKCFHPPILRVKGRLSPMKTDPLSEGHISAFFHEILSESQLKRLSQNLQVDASYETSKSLRLRINIFKTMSGFELAGRFITDQVPSFESLNLPVPTMQKIVSVENGLVVLTGPTGSGKTSTLAAMVHYLNALVHKRVICIEDPIEFVHQSRLCYISQREVHNDVSSFPIGIRATLREDPDVILIGELRDQESVETALTLSGTGHLVLTTLHAPTCSTAVEQLMDFFPHGQQNHIRKQIAFNLRSIISQRLLRHKSGRYRIPACEVLISTPAVRNIIRDGKTEQLPTMIETSKKEGMVSLDQVLKTLVHTQEVSLEEAWPHVIDPKTFRT